MMTPRRFHEPNVIVNMPAAQLQLVRWSEKGRTGSELITFTQRHRLVCRSSVDSRARGSARLRLGPHTGGLQRGPAAWNQNQTLFLAFLNACAQ